jgi:dipeptidyl aminopeptidase/acylaminoacyl peptidase
MYIHEFDWSPDGTKLVTVAGPGSGDNNWWTAKLHVVDVAAAAMHPIYTPKLQIATPRWSPDGKSIAFIEGLMSDEGSTGGDVFVIDAAGGTPRNLTANAKLSATSLQWADASHVIAGENIGGSAALARIDTNSGASETLWRGDELVTTAHLIGAAIARDGRTSAVIRESFHHPPEVWAGAFGAWKQVSHVNDKAPHPWGEAKSLTWKSDNFDVQGWLLLPREFVAARKYPLITIVHGGPASAFLPSWPSDRTALLSMKGYFVFMPNPRGSFGQGEAFTEANVKDFGYGDLRDVLTGLDTVLHDYPIDPHRLGIYGWSYGGYMTMWTETQTQRFRAAVAGAGIADWLSYNGENDIDEWMLPYFGATVYDDPAVYARSAPITFVKNVKTPTLILVGERDGECPAPQSFEWYHALKTLGVETQLVVYADEGHSIRKPEHKRDIARRLVSWFDSHLR